LKGEIDKGRDRDEKLRVSHYIVFFSSQLEKIVASAPPADPLPVGALTSNNRDKWTKAREALLKVGGDGGAQNSPLLG